MTKNLSEEFLCRICFNPLIEFGAIIAELNSAKFIDLLLMKQIRKTNFTKFGKLQFIQSTQKKFSPQKFLPLTYVLANIEVLVDSYLLILKKITLLKILK